MDARKNSDELHHEKHQALLAQLHQTNQVLGVLKNNLLDDLEKKVDNWVVRLNDVTETIHFLCYSHSLLARHFPHYFTNHAGYISDAKLITIQKKLDAILELVAISDCPLPSPHDVRHNKKAKRLIAKIHTKRAFEKLNSASVYDPKLALSDLESALCYQPKSFNVLRELASQQLQANQLKEAAVSIDKLMTVSSPTARDYGLRADLMKRSGYFSKALADYTRALQMPSSKYDRSHDGDNWFDAQVSLLSELGFYKQACKKLQKSLKIKNAHPNYLIHRYLFLADIHIAHQEFCRAFDVINKAFAVATTPNQPNRVNLNDIHAILWRRYDLSMQLTTYERAEKTCGDLRHYNDHRDFTNERYIQLYLKTHRPLQAIALCDESLTRNPQWGELYLLRAEAYYQMGLFKNALADIDKLLDVTNGSMRKSLRFKMDYLSARIALELKHFDTARLRAMHLKEELKHKLEKIATLYPQDESAYSRLTWNAQSKFHNKYAEVSAFISRFELLDAGLSAQADALKSATADTKQMISGLALNHAALFAGGLKGVNVPEALQDVNQRPSSP